MAALSHSTCSHHGQDCNDTHFHFHHTMGLALPEQFPVDKLQLNTLDPQT